MNVDEFIAREEQKHIELIWSSRNAFTVHDTDWLAEMKVVYGNACGLESKAPLDRRAKLTLTTEQLMDAAIQTVKQMSPEEKAKLRADLDARFRKPSKRN
ncbi:MAG: hypothetical protein ACRD4M_05940 [Candidatus Acidiferrales bacterium]